MSNQEFKSSLVLSLMFRIVASRSSHTFFSICITSKQWRNKFISQYGKSKNILFFLQLKCVSSAFDRRFFFLAPIGSPFPNWTLRPANSANTSLPDIRLDASPSSNVPSKDRASLLYGWFRRKNHRCPIKLKDFRNVNLLERVSFPHTGHASSPFMLH